MENRTVVIRLANNRWCWTALHSQSSNTRTGSDFKSGLANSPFGYEVKVKVKARLR